MAARYLRLSLVYLLMAVGAGFLLCASAAARDKGDAVRITRLAPDPRGGQAYRLTYQVPLPPEIFWRFKTDFANTFLEENRYILEHRLVSRQGNTVITENRYAYEPDARFSWQTTIFPELLRLEFKLIHSSQPGHEFHYGYIQLQPQGKATRVTQVAYYSFPGSFFWSYSPFKSGMRSFLEYTAQWERETAVRLRDHYESPQKTPESRAAKRPQPK